MKTKLLCLVSFVTLGALSTLGWVAANQSRNDKLQGKEDFLRASVVSLMDKIDRNLFERYGDVQAFAMSEPARSMDPKRLEHFMNLMMPTYAPVYSLMMVTNTQGVIVAVNTLDGSGNPVSTTGLLGQNVKGQTWFDQAMKSKWSPGTAFVEDVYQTDELVSFTGGAKKFMNFTAPIVNEEGKVIGIWTNRMDYEEVVGKMLLNETENLKSSRISMVFASLFASDGKLLGNSSKLEQGPLATDKLGFEKETAKSQGTLVSNGETFETLNFLTKSKGYSSYPGQGWILQMQVPMIETNSSFLLTLGIAGLAILFSGAIASFVLISPIEKVLTVIAQELARTSHEIRNSSTNLAVSSKNVSETSSKSASALEETASSIEELSSILNQNAEHAKLASQVAEEAKIQAQQSENEISTLISSMRNVAQSSKKISDITSVIEDIAFQTNLLALNAAVEAARAGEHGRGFGVVAEAVRNLAAKTSTASKDISHLIQDSLEQVGKGNQAADTSAVALNRIVQSIAKLAELNEGISSAGLQQAKGITQIANAVSDLDRSTEQNVQTSTEVAAASEKSESLSVRLTSLVNDLERTVHGSSTQQAS